MCVCVCVVGPGNKKNVDMGLMTPFEKYYNSLSNFWKIKNLCIKITFNLICFEINSISAPKQSVSSLFDFVLSVLMQ